ncbi:DUF6927 domain-containing protein [Modicisalibacter xianhensis]|uniref:DUF6927 domain-containing protein n=1 Tax=Modicisalibacter xianhensis TaxID=442341 RepID=A0A1I3ERK5_9GAMM|nr:hypothetical protein [Halomonas xianhensis]SFI01582.1 hypothetical protein SAMN04487959_114133 [Halomonas xianhensis]
MGTLCMAMPADRKAYLDENYSTKDGSQTVLKSSFVGSTYYAAIKIKRPGEAPDQAPFEYTLGAVIKTSSMQGEFCYKSMDETMGPHESQCPMSILKLLSPLEELEQLGVVVGTSLKYAGEWRERCRKHAESKKQRARLKAGDRIKLPYSVRFVGGLECDTFTKVDLPRKRNVFRPEGSSMLVRLQARHLDDAVVLA